MESDGPEERDTTRKIAASVAEEMARHRREVQGWAAGLALMRQVDSAVARVDGGPSRTRSDGNPALFDLFDAWLPYVVRFMELLDNPELHQDAFPVLQGSRNYFDLPVAIDYLNVRAIRGLAGRREVGYLVDSDHSMRMLFDESMPGVAFEPKAGVFSNFLTSFTHGFRIFRKKALAPGAVSHVKFTVDCTNHGYHLEYWPQFFYSPVAFGSHPTKPVSAVIATNDYHFQGRQKGSAVVRDPRLHRADATSLATTLSAF